MTKITLIKCQVIWKVIFSNKFIFFNIQHLNDDQSRIDKVMIGVDSMQDAARFLKNEASKLTWGKAHSDIKNLKI